MVPHLNQNKAPDFYAKIPVKSHMVSKNRRPIRFNRKTGKPFLGKSGSLESAERHLQLHLMKARHDMNLCLPIRVDCHVALHFHFADFYTAKGLRRKTLPDLSNLIQIVEDSLQKSGIIENDNLITSLDGSRRLPGKDNFLEIWIWADSQ